MGRRGDPIRAGMLALLALISVYGFGKYVRGLVSGSPDRVSTPAAAPHREGSKPPAPEAAPPARQPAQRHTASDHTAWDRMRERLGRDLVAERGPDGRVQAVRGAPGQGEFKPGFDPSDAQKAISRAREVLELAGPLLGLEAGLPLGEPSVNVSGVSAQVSFVETVAGLPVEPGGAVSVDLGPQGELLGVSSSYVAPLRIGNERRLSADEARLRAHAAAPTGAGTKMLGTSGGEPLIWVTRSPDGATGRHAYGYDAGGTRIVVDAGNGKLLYRRDQRQH